MTTSGPTRLAMLGGFLRPDEQVASGGVRAAYQVSMGIAEARAYDAIDTFHDLINLRTSTLKVVPPQTGTRVRLRDRRELLCEATDYEVIFAPGTEQEHYLPHAFRPLGQVAPIVCDVDSAYSGPQWTHFFIGAASGAICADDVFLVKSRAAERLVKSTWTRWRSWMPAICAPHFVVVPQAIELAANRPQPALRALVRQQLGIEQSACLALTFSRLNAGTKGDLPALIAVWREVVRSVPGSMLVLAGAAWDRVFVEELRTTARLFDVGQHVVILPNPYEVWPNARTALMSAADIFVHLSTGIEETAPLVVCEAMAHGLVPVVAEWSGMPELVAHLEDGWVVPTIVAPVPEELTHYGGWGRDFSLNMDLGSCTVCDPAVLEDALITLVRDASLRAGLAERAARRAERDFGVERATAARLDAFREARRRVEGSAVPARPTPIFDIRELMRCFGGRPLSGDISLSTCDRENALSMREWRNGTARQILESLIEGVEHTEGARASEVLRTAYRRLVGDAAAEGTADTELLEMYGRCLCRLISHRVIRSSHAALASK